MELYKKSEEETDIDLADAYVSLSICYMNKGDNVSTAQYLPEAKRIYEKMLGENNLRTASVYQALGSHFAELRGGLGFAVQYTEKALRIQKRILGEEHPETAVSYSNLAMIRWDMGEKEEAIAMAEKALKINRSVLGTENHELIATGYNNLGRMYAEYGNAEKGIIYIEKARDIMEMISCDIYVLGKIYTNLARQCWRAGRKEDALKHMRRAKEIFILSTSKNSEEVRDIEKDINYILNDMHSSKKQMVSGGEVPKKETVLEIFWGKWKKKK